MFLLFLKINLILLIIEHLKFKQDSCKTGTKYLCLKINIVKNHNMTSKVKYTILGYLKRFSQVKFQIKY